MARKITLFFLSVTILLSTIWYSSFDADSSLLGLGSSVLTAEDVSCGDVPAKIQEVTIEKNVINTQLERIRTELRSLSGKKSELDISQKQIEAEKSRLTDFENDFFKETQFENADELRTSIQKIALNIVDLKEKVAHSTNFIRNRILNRKIRILENRQEKNSVLLSKYTSALNTENARIENKQDENSTETKNLIQQIAQKENSRKNYEDALQQLENSQTQLNTKNITCSQEIMQNTQTIQNSSETQNTDSAQTGSSNTGANNQTHVQETVVTAQTETITSQTTNSSSTVTISEDNNTIGSAGAQHTSGTATTTNTSTTTNNSTSSTTSQETNTLASGQKETSANSSTQADSSTSVTQVSQNTNMANAGDNLAQSSNTNNNTLEIPGILPIIQPLYTVRAPFYDVNDSDIINVKQGDVCWFSFRNIQNQPKDHKPFQGLSLWLTRTDNSPKMFDEIHFYVNKKPQTFFDSPDGIAIYVGPEVMSEKYTPNYLRRNNLGTLDAHYWMFSSSMLNKVGYTKSSKMDGYYGCELFGCPEFSAIPSLNHLYFSYSANGEGERPLQINGFYFREPMNFLVFHGCSPKNSPIPKL